MTDEQAEARRLRIEELERAEAERTLAVEMRALSLLKELVDVCTEAGGLDGIEVVEAKLKAMFPGQHPVHRLATLRHFAECVVGLTGTLLYQDDQGLGGS